MIHSRAKRESDNRAKRDNERLWLVIIIVMTVTVSETFDISHVFFLLTVAKLSTLKNSPVFWPTLYIWQNKFSGAREMKIKLQMR